MTDQDNMDGNLFGFRKHGIIQRTGTATPMPEGEKNVATYELSEESLDLEKKGHFKESPNPPPKEKVKDPRDDKVIEFGLENAKVIDREDEGVLEFGVEGTKSSPGRSKVRRQTTIKDLKKQGGGEPKLDYISIDEEEGAKQPKKDDGIPKKDAHRPHDEEKEDLEYIPIDDDDAPALQKKTPPPPKDAPHSPKTPRPPMEEEGEELPTTTPVDATSNYDTMDLKEMKPKDLIFCPHCKSKIEIPSPKRPIIVKCTGCGKKGTLRY